MTRARLARVLGALLAASSLFACGVSLSGTPNDAPPGDEAGGDAPGNGEAASNADGASQSEAGDEDGGDGAVEAALDGGKDALPPCQAGTTRGPSGSCEQCTTACASRTCSGNLCDPVVFAIADLTTGQTNGIVGADKLCLTAFQGGFDPNAKAGRVIAWVSTLGAAIKTRTKPNMRPHRLADGSMLAANYLGLFDGNSKVIDLTVDRSPVSGDVWTGSNKDGSVYADTCGNWTAANASAQGGFGTIGGGGDLWILNSSAGCDQPKHLYCIEQLD